MQRNADNVGMDVNQLATHGIMLVIYSMLMLASMYLLISLNGLRRYLMLLFCLSFSWSFAMELLSALGFISVNEARQFGYWLTHITSGAFVSLLAIDRYFFKRGIGNRCPTTKTINGLRNESGQHHRSG